MATISITISGPKASGKTTIAAALGEILQEHGVSVAFYEDGSAKKTRLDTHHAGERLERVKAHVDISTVQE